MKILFFQLGFLLITVNAVANQNLPQIFFKAPKGLDEEVPTYDVIFPDGHEDTLMLQHFVARPKAILSKKACNFIGNLKNDPIATVAVTGCYGEETVTFSINSKHSFYTNIFELDINGNVHGIEIPYNLPSPLISDESMQDVNYGKNHVKKDMKHDLPTTLKLKLKISYDDNYMNSDGGFVDNDEAEAWIDSVITHVQGYFFNSTALGTSMTLVILDYQYYPGEHWIADGPSMTIVRDLTFQDPADANLWVFLCYDENNTGAQGLSSASPLCPADGQGPLPECKTRGNIVEKIFNNAAATAWAMGHEMGHELTMPHDSEPPVCDAIGIMGAHGPHNNAYYYSSCSREAFRNHYNEVVERDGVFCLEKKTRMVAVSGINWNGRYDFYYPTNTEVFDIQFEESVATFYCQNGTMTQEFKIDHAVGGFLQGMPYVCGGHFLDFTNHYSDECVPLDGSVMPKVKMTQNRAKFAAVNIDDNTIFVTGGLGVAANFSTTEFISLSSPARPGPNIPFKIVMHCMVKLPTGLIYMIGGCESPNIAMDGAVCNTASNRVWIFDPNSDFQMIQGPSLQQGRVHHACGTFVDDSGETNIIVAGGRKSMNSHDILDSVEILNPSKINAWITGPNLPINLSSHKMVTTPDEKKVIVAGGETGTGQMSNLLIKYSGLGSSWTIMNEKINILSDARKDFVAFVVPNDLTYCEYCKTDEWCLS